MFFLAPYCPAIGNLWALIHGFCRAREGRLESLCGQADLTPHGKGHWMEFAQVHSIVVDLDDRAFLRDACVIRERRPQRKNQVALIHEPARDRGA